MANSFDFSDTANELQRLIFKRGPNITSAVLVYKDSNDDVRWYRSGTLESSEAVIMMEKVKLELTGRS